jgi:hypothetical protein
VSDDVRQVSPGPEEAWERLTDDPHVRGIETARVDEVGGWQVTVWAMEFVQDGPLETDMRRRIADALGAVNGVTRADEEDREVWLVTGTPSGKELTEAAARVVDELADKFVSPCVASKGRHPHAPVSGSSPTASPARSPTGPSWRPARTTCGQATHRSCRARTVLPLACRSDRARAGRLGGLAAVTHLAFGCVRPSACADCPACRCQ